MASYDRQFEVVRPSLDRLNRVALEVADPRLLDPTNGSVVPIIDGEWVQQDSTYKWVRASSADRPSCVVIDERGDYGVQASRKLSAIMMPGFEADTIVYSTSIASLGEALKIGAVNNSLSGSVARVGLIPQGGTNLIVGYVTRLPATNGNRLRFWRTGV